MIAIMEPVLYSVNGDKRWVDWDYNTCDFNW